jgi:hypothetical protein
MSTNEITSCTSRWCRGLLEITSKDKTSDPVDDPIFQFQANFSHRMAREATYTIGIISKDLTANGWSS